MKTKVNNPMNWENEAKDSVHQRLVGSNKAAIGMIENELENDFFTFNGTLSLTNIGEEQISFPTVSSGDDHALDDGSYMHQDFIIDGNFATLLQQTDNDL